MKKIHSLSRIAFALIFLASLSLAAGKPDLSGTWVLDKTRSFSNPPGLDQTMTIVHKGDEVSLEARVTVQGKETVVNETWMLDGKEREFTPPGAPSGAKANAALRGCRGSAAFWWKTNQPPTAPKAPFSSRQHASTRSQPMAAA